MIVPINGGGVCASRAIPSVRHICFGVVNSLPPSPSIRSASFGPLHSLSPLGLAIRIHRCSAQTTLTPSLLSPKQTNKKNVFAKRSLYTMHLMHPASSRYVGSEFFQALRFFFIFTKVHNSCFVDLRCFFFLLDVYHLCRGRLQMLLL